MNIGNSLLAASMFLALAFAVTAPWFFEPGYLFLLDMVWGSESSPLLQKLTLSGVLFCAGFFMYMLAAYFFAWRWAIMSGCIYMFNPYVYERFAAGHWLVLAGYALFPLVLWSILRKKYLVFLLLFTAYPFVSPHWAYIAFFFLLALFLVQRKFLFASLFSFSGAVFYVLFKNTQSALLNITLRDFHAFQTQTDPSFGVFFNVLSLYGFWNQSLFLPKELNQYWWMLTLLLLFFSALGVFAFLKKKRILGITAALAFIPALFIAVGYGSELTKPFINFLFAALPGFGGLRETAKVTGLLAFSYALLAPMGALALRSKMVFALLLAIPLFSVYPMFWGFGGQLQPADYPASWYMANEITKKDAQKILFLPWHGYMRLPFANNTNVSNPAPKFFEVPVVAGKNLDNPYLLPNNENQWDKKIASLLHSFETTDTSILFFSSQGVTHIILAKLEDWNRYAFFKQSSLLHAVFETDDLILYEITI